MNINFFCLILLFVLSSCSTSQVVSISNSASNVLIIGVYNPITIAAEKVNDKHIRLESEQLTFLKGGRGQYIAEAKTPGRAEIIVFKKNKIIDTIYMRIKRLPDPVARLAIKNYHLGDEGLRAFKANQGIIARIENCDIDANCKVESFMVVRITKGRDPIEALNEGAYFQERTKKLILAATQDDIYYFTNIKVRCPGDEFAYRVNDIVHHIK